MLWKLIQLLVLSFSQRLQCVCSSASWIFYFKDGLSCGKEKRCGQFEQYFESLGSEKNKQNKSLQCLLWFHWCIIFILKNKTEETTSPSSSADHVHKPFPTPTPKGNMAGVKDKLIMMNIKETHSLFLLSLCIAMSHSRESRGRRPRGHSYPEQPSYSVQRRPGAWLRASSTSGRSNLRAELSCVTNSLCCNISSLKKSRPQLRQPRESVNKR